MVEQARPRLTAVERHLQVANQLNRQFTVAAPNRVWAGDITYIWTLEGWLYLDVLLDRYSRAVIGWAMGGTTHRGVTATGSQSRTALARGLAMRVALYARFSKDWDTTGN